MGNILKKTGDVIVTCVIRIAFFFWMLAVRVMYLPGVRYESKEVKKLIKKPCIVVSHHTSHLDGSFIPQVLWGKKLHVLVTTKWYEKKGLKIFFSHLDYIPIDKKTMDTEWIERTKEKLAKGKSILIFPEGELYKEGVGEFQPGFLMLARQTEVPVIPIGVKGGYKKWHRNEIVVGNPIEFDIYQKGRPSIILKEGAKLYREKVIDLLGMEQHEPVVLPKELLSENL